ncbi:MAG TPA: tetratricopeptide repeat protein [Enhygromyxa sp.]|nr:tetratricopeptide repeat protein [Enhygromyxa sp.]
MAPTHRALPLLALSLTAFLSSGCATFRDANTPLEEAHIALEAGDEAKAESLYRDAMRSKGKHSEEARALLINLLVNRGGRLMEQGKADDAMEHYREALSLDQARDESRIAYARALMKAERFTEAIDVLMEGKSCRGCKSLISVIYLERGNAEVRDGEYADALEDYDMALSMSRDPLTVLAKVDVYTIGKYGTAAEAVGYLDQALRLMPVDQIGAQQVWWEKRTAVLYNAAISGEHGVLDSALALEDPRSNVDPARRTLDRLQLHMYVASLQIYVKAYELGTERGLRTYAEAKGAVPEAELAKLRETLMGLFMQRVATHFADDDDSAARAALAQALELDPDNRILNFQHIIATAARNTGTARQLLSGFESDPEYNRVRALVETVYARKMIGIGQLSAARTAVEKAERYDPTLLETHLVRAELEAESRFPELKKTWAENFREIATYSYPGGRINNYARALAELRFIQAKFDDAAARDYLRAPAFQKRVEQLEAKIKAFYPYEAELADAADKTTLVFAREESGEYEVKVQTPKGEQSIKVPGESQIELPLGAPGFVIVHGPGGRKALFAEPGVKIVVKV